MWWQNDNLCFCKHCLHHLSCPFPLPPYDFVAKTFPSLWHCTIVDYRQGNKSRLTGFNRDVLPRDCIYMVVHAVTEKRIYVSQSLVYALACWCLFISPTCLWMACLAFHKPYFCVFLSSSSSAEMTQLNAVYSGGILPQILMCAGRLHVVCFIFFTIAVLIRHLLHRVHSQGHAMERKRPWLGLVWIFISCRTDTMNCVKLSIWLIVEP